MDIGAEKLEIMKMVLETDNPGILQSIKNIFKNNPTIDFWDELSQYQKSEILKGIEEIDNDESIAYEEIMKKYR